MSNLQTYYHFKLDFQKVDQHTGGKWLIHGTKRRKKNQLQTLEHSITQLEDGNCSSIKIQCYSRKTKPSLLMH